MSGFLIYYVKNLPQSKPKFSLKRNVIYSLEMETVKEKVIVPDFLLSFLNQMQWKLDDRFIFL